MPSADCIEKFNKIVPDIGRLVEKPHFEEIPTFDLTVIIAAYNTEKYIKECLESVLKQKTKYAVEVLIVNDGSTDGTEKIISEYLSDKRVRYFSQENRGQSAARNRAIDISRGKYLMIVDSDDLISEDCIECLLDTAYSTGSEIVEGSIDRFYKKCHFTSPERIRIVTRSNAKNPNFVLTSYGYSVAKVFKRNLWENVRYPEGYIFEDIISKFVLRRIANGVTYVNRVVYGYRWNGESSSHGGDSLKKLDSVWVLPKIFGICAENGVKRDRTFYLLALNHIGLLNFITTKNQSDEIKRAAFEVMRTQLLSLKDVKHKRLPLMFKVLDKSIISGDLIKWQYFSDIILKYGFVKKYRERN